MGFNNYVTPHVALGLVVITKKGGEVCIPSYICLQLYDLIKYQYICTLYTLVYKDVWRNL